MILSIYLVVAIIKNQLGLELYKINFAASQRNNSEKEPIWRGFSNFSDKLPDAKSCMELRLFDF